MLEHIDEGNAEAGNHARNSALSIHAFGENTEHEHGENGRSREAEGNGHGAGSKIRWVQAEVTGEDNGADHRNAAGVEFVLFRNLRLQNSFEEIMGNG